jgi:plasmid stabilization system protein ParE
MILKYSQKALNDINVIYDYLFDNFGERVADGRRNEIHKSIRLLGDNPFMGRSIDGHDQNLRQTRSNQSIIMYDIDDKTLEILHIVDGRTDFKNNLSK